MAKIPASKSELSAYLREQIDFLKSSSTSYDIGFSSESKRLATTARVLVHDTDRSTSLLTLCELKDKLQFLSTASPFKENNLISQSLLTCEQHYADKIMVAPILDESISTASTEGFEIWWNAIVIRDSKQNYFSRKDVVLFLANKVGGAHVDHELDEKFVNLHRYNSMGWTMVDAQGISTPMENHMPASMRQIAHELIKTLDPEFIFTPPQSEGLLMTTRSSFASVDPIENIAINESPTPTFDQWLVAATRKTLGRNDPCYCGSGLKFKKCHLNRR